MVVNPYKSPQVPDGLKPQSGSEVRGNQVDYRTLLIVIPAIVGAVVGWVIFGPFAGLAPGDPSRPSIAAGWGGLVGLAAGCLLRVLLSALRELRVFVVFVFVVADFALFAGTVRSQPLDPAAWGSDHVGQPVPAIHLRR